MNASGRSDIIRVQYIRVSISTLFRSVVLCHCVLEADRNSGVFTPDMAAEMRIQTMDIFGHWRYIVSVGIFINAISEHMSSTLNTCLAHTSTLCTGRGTARLRGFRQLCWCIYMVGITGVFRQECSCMYMVCSVESVGVSLWVEACTV